MARKSNQLTTLFVKNTFEPKLHSDGNGLYLNVTPSGAKSWRFIRTANRKRTEYGLGSYPAVSLKDAREKCAEFQRALAKGENPVHSEKQSAATEAKFGVVAEGYIDAHAPSWKSLKHAQQWRSTLETYAKSIWHKSVDHVSVDDMLTILQPIWGKKTETAQRVRGRIECVLDAAKVQGLRAGDNPAAWRGNLQLLLAKVKKGPIRHHPALPYAAMPDFMRELSTRPALSARALEFTILTASRTSEALNACWSELDLNARIWTIPSNRMKAGREHRVPLSPPAMDLLSKLERANEFVFPGTKRGKPLSNMSMLNLLNRMDQSDITVHGFRSTFRDWCGDLATDMPREIAEHALAHAVGSEVERAYRRGDALEQRRELMERWANHIQGKA